MGEQSLFSQLNLPWRAGGKKKIRATQLQGIGGGPFQFTVLQLEKYSEV